MSHSTASADSGAHPASSTAVEEDWLASFCQAAQEKRFTSHVEVQEEGLTVTYLDTGVQAHLKKGAQLLVGQKIPRIEADAYQITWPSTSGYVYRVEAADLARATRPTELARSMWQDLPAMSQQFVAFPDFDPASRAVTVQKLRMRTLGAEVVTVNAGTYLDIGIARNLPGMSIIRTGLLPPRNFVALPPAQVKQLLESGLLRIADGTKPELKENVIDLTQGEVARTIRSQVMRDLHGVDKDCGKILVKLGTIVEVFLKSAAGVLFVRTPAREIFAFDIKSEQGNNLHHLGPNEPAKEDLVTKGSGIGIFEWPDKKWEDYERMSAKQPLIGGLTPLEIITADPSKGGACDVCGHYFGQHAEECEHRGVTWP